MDSQINTEEAVMIGTIIATIIQSTKFFLKENESFKNLIPAIAVIIGMMIEWLFIAGESYTMKDVLFNGAIYGFAAIGGREMVSYGRSGQKKEPQGE